MSTHNICFHGEIRIIFTWYSLFSRRMVKVPYILYFLQDKESTPVPMGPAQDQRVSKVVFKGSRCIFREGNCCQNCFVSFYNNEKATVSKLFCLLLQ